MNGREERQQDENQEVRIHRQQLDRPSKRRAREVINGWVDYVSSVGGRDCSDDWHSSSTGLSGDSEEMDDVCHTESDGVTSDSDSFDDCERNGIPSEDVLLKVWGPFLRRGTTDATGKTIGSGTDSGGNKKRERSSDSLAEVSNDDDSTSEGSDGSYGSLADFIC